MKYFKRQEFKSSFYQYSYFLIGLIACCYVFIRAILIDVTYDESVTIGIFIPQSFLQIIYSSHSSANNHILNSILIKLFFTTGFNSLAIARLPNVLASIFYVYFAYRISKELFNKNIGVLFFTLLLCNPYLLEFFSLARGYGLALTFLLISIYYFLKFNKAQERKHAFYSLIAGSFAVLSNFSLLFYLSGLIFVIYYSCLITKSERKYFLKLLKGSLIILFVLIIIIYEPVKKLHQSGELWYGGIDGIYWDTLLSLTSYTIGKPYNDILGLKILFYFIILLSIIIIVNIISDSEKHKLFKSRKFILLLLLITPAIINIFGHRIFGIKYLIDRTALFYYPLIIIVFTIFANDVINKYVLNFTTVLFVSFSIVMVINFTLCANFYKTTTWFHDCHTTEIMKYLNEKGIDRKENVKLYSSWPFQCSIIYYKEKNEFKNVTYCGSKIEPINLGKSDYYLYLNQTMYLVGYYEKDEPIKKLKSDTVLYFKDEEVFLLSNFRQ